MIRLGSVMEVCYAQNAIFEILPWKKNLNKSNLCSTERKCYFDQKKLYKRSRINIHYPQIIFLWRNITRQRDYCIIHKNEKRNIIKCLKRF